MLKKIAVTGSIASGKSTVCQLFASWGSYTVSADDLVVQAFSSHTSIGKEVCQIFGDDVVEGERIVRSRLAQKIVRAPDLLTKLEAICHPYVNDEIQKIYRTICYETKYSLFVAEIPLLFESKFPLWPWFDVTIIVICDEKKARKRYIDKKDNEEFFSFLSSRLLPTEEKTKRATYTIENNDSLIDLESSSKRIFEKIIT